MVHRKKPAKYIVLISLVITVITYSKAFAQVNDTVESEITVQDSIFTADQVQKGIKVFKLLCAECHLPEQFTMEVFINTWDGRYLFELYELIRTTMPYENPGRLKKKEVANVLSYLLSLNNLPAGNSALPTNSGKLKQIRIENLSQRRKKE